jgi:hypothetical protein
MRSTPDIDAIIRKAKRQRADYIASTLRGRMLPLALVALLSFALVQFAVGTSEEQAQPDAVADASMQNS